MTDSLHTPLLEVLLVEGEGKAWYPCPYFLPTGVVSLSGMQICG